jgi:hypothetical protein
MKSINRHKQTNQINQQAQKQSTGTTTKKRTISRHNQNTKQTNQNQSTGTIKKTTTKSSTGTKQQ